MTGHRPKVLIRPAPGAKKKAEVDNRHLIEKAEEKAKERARRRAEKT